MEINRIIHAPARLKIMAILEAAGKADFVYLQKETGLTSGNLSVQLQNLKEADYIEIEKSFVGNYPQTLCSITKAGRKAFGSYRKQLLQTLDIAQD